MKHRITLPLLIASLVFGTAFSASAQKLNIGTVDMKKVFESYYKTKDAESRINEARNSAKKELEDRMETLKKMGEEVQKLDEEIKSPALSKDSKESKSKTRDEKAGEFAVMQREIQEFRVTREKQLQEQSVRMRGGIVDEINKVVTDRVKSDQFDIVLDKSGPSLNGVPVVLFAKDSYDFTADVITALNKNKGTEKPATETSGAPATPAAAAATPAAPKKK